MTSGILCFIEETFISHKLDIGLIEELLKQDLKAFDQFSSRIPFFEMPAFCYRHLLFYSVIKIVQYFNLFGDSCESRWWFSGVHHEIVRRLILSVRYRSESLLKERIFIHLFIYLYVLLFLPLFPFTLFGKNPVADSRYRVAGWNFFLCVFLFFFFFFKKPRGVGSFFIPHNRQWWAGCGSPGIFLHILSLYESLRVQLAYLRTILIFFFKHHTRLHKDR